MCISMLTEITSVTWQWETLTLYTETFTRSEYWISLLYCCLVVGLILHNCWHLWLYTAILCSRKCVIKSYTRMNTPDCQKNVYMSMQYLWLLFGTHQWYTSSRICSDELSYFSVKSYVPLQYQKYILPFSIVAKQQQLTNTQSGIRQ